MTTVSRLLVYPIKSRAGLTLQRAEVTTRKNAQNPRWMVVDEVDVELRP